ncbi:hypothetical protein BGW36DRAFT_289203 [Talaromyces proteolyticus]|uniref:Zn(2)-C6 fungal-type domain-containing protein n=1 Tax=Talaromyces proteolyticus TaxID=1131652 RepID=A0AAD4L135_9EURO|nr:uncharacterized protein BGW36DRAFT_289203 [Talaromyces proteolyticus]KAH8702206.1 hypothetical protein BGW36DRAFT_289203 [Talaromyces proteolyticus]
MDHEALITSSSTEPAKVLPVCNACRSRKVRCDRVQPVCGPCMRLKLQCSFDRSSVSPNSDIGDLSTHTQAGTKRKRSCRACGSCRAVKAKCSGSGPCERCLSRSRVCDLVADPSHQFSDDLLMSMPTPRTVTSNTSTNTTWPLDRVATRSCIDAYFNAETGAAPAFLHKSSILADWSRGIIDPNLLKCIVATGLFANDSRPEARVTARVWIQEVQEDAFKRIGKQTVTHLRILVMLLCFHFRAGNFPDAWSLLALAARSAFTMRLNYERDERDPLIQESHRRLVWIIYEMDCLCSGGIDDLAVCPVERIHIRLPCDERTFEMGIPSKARFLKDTRQDPGANVDAHAFNLELLFIRDRILSRYTKNVRRTGKSPAESHQEMESLQAELDRFERSLPLELKLSSRSLVVMGHSREASAYARLHTMWLMCHCDLYRFCVPGIRESVPKDALALTPSDFIEYCQRVCLSNAVQLCGLWSNLYHLESSERLGDGFLAVAIYQVSGILHHLPHLLPDEGDRCIASLKKKLLEALQLALPLRPTYDYAKSCLKDAERLVNALGRGSVPRLSPVSKVVEGMEATAREHFASRHSFLQQLDKDQEAVDKGTENQTIRSVSPDEIDHLDERTVPSYPITEWNLLDRERRVEHEVEQGVSDLYLWDPFNMQLNGYYDPSLEFSFAS